MVTRVIKTSWVILCAIIAVWGVLGEGDAPLVGTYILCVFTMPTGLLIYVFASLAMKDAPGDHVEACIVHALVILAGYMQWFVLLPKLVHRMKREKSFWIWGLLIVSSIGILYGLYRFYLHVFPDSNMA